MSEVKNSKSQIRLPLLLSGAVALGLLIGATMSNPGAEFNNVSSGAIKIKEILTLINQNYVDEVKTDKLVDGAIVNMLHDLDPHSYYIPAKDQALVNSQLSGNFEGIGIQFDIIRDTIYVVTPLKGGPSEKLGIQTGDKIVTVDGENVGGVGIGTRGVFDKLRGPKGSKVNVDIKRRGEKSLLNFTIVRDKIPENSVDVYYMVSSDIGYIKFNSFSQTTYDEVTNALKDLEKQGMSKLILDIQGNGGGYMISAVNLVDEFLAGNKLIVSQKDKNPQNTEEYYARRKGLFEKGPIIILVDESSASSSEILAGALQDNDRALIVGRRTFGKGLVQLQYPLSDGSEVRLTIARYYTPSGRSIQKPYDDYNEYEKDILNRFNHGEFYSADSIHFNDSLKYKTSKGRVVYGGGGIMPDYFVPLDSSQNSSYYTRLFGNNVIREFCYNYAESNKQKLSQVDFEKYQETFEVTPAMFDEVISIGKEVGVPFDKAGFEKSKNLMGTTMKALIARSFWGEEGFYKIYNETDEIFQRSLKLFDQAEQLALK